VIVPAELDDQSRDGNENCVVLSRLKTSQRNSRPTRSRIGNLRYKSLWGACAHFSHFFGNLTLQFVL
jgi:hypothetical protein